MNQVLIERFKNINSLVCPISGIVILVGGNNSGKSSVLQAIQFGVSVAQTSLMQGGKWKSDRVSTSIGQADLVYTPIKEVHSLARNGRLREPEAEAIKITYSDDSQECSISVRKGRNKNIGLELTGSKLGSHLQSLTSQYCALVTGLAGIPSAEEYETPMVVRKAAARGDSNSVFRNILLQLSNMPAKWAQFSEQMSRVFPGYQISVSFNPELDEYIDCTVTRNGMRFPIDTCGTGVLQAIQIFSYINLFEPKLLLLDEPDSHLHPNNQKALAQELITAANGGLNIIVSSHSKHLVESLYDDATLVWLRAGKIEPIVDEYELKALMEIGALGVGARITDPEYIFLTEDTKSDLFKTLLSANSFDLTKCEVLSYSGASNLETAKILIENLRRSYPKAKYIVHRDRDFKNQEEIDSYQSKLLAENIHTYIPVGNDIESCFLTPEHISETCGVGVTHATDILQAAFADCKESLHVKYINTVTDNLRKRSLPINPGEISLEANKLLTGPNSPATHGKTLLKSLKNQLGIGKLPTSVENKSSYLTQTELIKLQS